MKTLIILCCIIFCFKLAAQDKLPGNYSDYFGNKIVINSDLTFQYTWHFDLSGSWDNGTWTIRNDTIYFIAIPVYDTLSYTTNHNKRRDSLILSLDENTERLTKPDLGVLSSGGQRRVPYPEKLFYHHDKLYSIDKTGKLITKKIRWFWTKKKVRPWYVRTNY